MQYNERFGMKDLFMNRELKGIFPQFSKKDKLKNVYSYEWVEKKIADYLKSVFGGRKSGDSIVIKGKFKDKFKQIKAMQKMIEDMFNSIPAITKNIRHDTKLITPFQSIAQLKEIQTPEKKIAAMQIVLDNLNYNPNFQSQDGFRSEILPNDYYRRQDIWLKSVGWYGKRR